MKISTRVEYGILALTDIAMYSEYGTSVSAPDIAVRQNISQKYLEQIWTTASWRKCIHLERIRPASAERSTPAYGRN